MDDDEELDRGGLVAADMAFLDSQARGDTKARSVRLAIRAYILWVQADEEALIAWLSRIREANGNGPRT